MDKTTRQQLINRAKQLFVLHPTWGRRPVNEQLRKEFDVGLRWSTLGTLMKELNTPNSLRRQLLNVGFLPYERRVINEFIESESRVYVREAIADRMLIYQVALARGKTKRQYSKQIRDIYRANDWIIRATLPRNDPRSRAGQEGQPDVYALLRHYRDKSIASGDYIPRPKKRGSKAQIAEQRRRYKQKQKTQKLLGNKPSGNIEDWIRQLRLAVTRESDRARIAQLEAQIQRLEGLT